MEKKVQARHEEVLEKTFSFLTEKWPHRGFVHKFDDSVQVTEDPSLGKGEIFMWARVSGGESGGKPVEAPKAKPRIVPKKKILEDEVNFPPPSKRRR